MRETEPIVFCRTDPTGNIFYIIAWAFRALDERHEYGKKNELVQRVRDCGSYETALKIIAEYVELMEVV